jgi:DNA processing protein
MGSPHRAARRAEGRGDGPRLAAGRPLTAAALAVAESPRGRAGDPTRAPHAWAIEDAGYPPALRDLADAPPRVYTLGAAVPARSRCVALVGSRAASPYGRAMADRLARDLAALGFTIVSGLARGIDDAAHRGALAAGGSTIAVVPCGLDALAPREPLAAELAARGTLLSELASGPPFGRGAFVRRNRLIAALSSVTVVVEAAERSGALTTAAFAKRLGRPVAAVPGDLDRPTAHGVLALLRDGATACGGAGDVLALVGPAAAPAADADPLARLAAALDDVPATVEALAARAVVPLPEALAALLQLQWAGVAAAAGGQRWRRAGGRAR